MKNHFFKIYFAPFPGYFDRKLYSFCASSDGWFLIWSNFGSFSRVRRWSCSVCATRADGKWSRPGPPRRTPRSTATSASSGGPIAAGLPHHFTSTRSHAQTEPGHDVRGVTPTFGRAVGAELVVLLPQQPGQDGLVLLVPFLGSLPLRARCHVCRGSGLGPGPCGAAGCRGVLGRC